LIERLQDLEKVSPHPILVALGNLGPDAKPAVPALLKLLEIGDSIFSGDVMNVLGQIGPDSKIAVPRLLTRLEGPSEFDRARAVQALGRIGPEARTAVSALKKRQEDTSKMVRVWTAFALARTTGDSKSQVAVLMELWKADRGNDSLRSGPASSVRYYIAQALELLGADARPARDLLLEAVLDEHTPLGTRSHVARALGQLQDDVDAIVPKLIGLVERKAEPYARVENCEQACEALGLLGPKAKAAIPYLRRLLDEDENRIVDAATRALEKIETK
jgi:HEAT repeat protein